MENLPQVFSYQDREVRTVLKDGEPWFVAKDVCLILEIANSRDALERLDSDEKGVVLTDTLGGVQELQAVNETGLYTLILGSRKPEAKEFKRWVTHEIIPSIRKHGAFLTPDKIEEVLSDPDTIIRLATDLKAERERSALLQSKVEEDKPKVLFADSVAGSKTSILVGEMAKILRQNNIIIGQNRLFRWMRENGYLCKRGESYNLPTQRTCQQGLMEIKETTISNPNGNTITTLTPKVTGKGQIYFLDKLREVL